jgi:eukaryotic-like serine/threonine-protein kinase
MSTSAAPERDLGFAGSIIKGRYKVNAVTSMSRDVVVYAAEEIRYGRPIALKVLRDEVAGDAEFVSALRMQASALAISTHVHRGLPRIYECGTTDTGKLFIALELTKGPTLREVLDARGPLDPSTALRIASQVGEALETLHSSRIVHGQLGLESVLLVRDEEGTERITLVGVELTAAYRTTTGRRRRDASTSAYVAPEQLAGGETTDATDQYALGMLLRELLTADGSREPIDVHTETRPLSSEIARIITTALETEPARRFADISVMVNDLWAAQTALEESPRRSRAVEPRANIDRRQRSHPPRVILRVAAAIATAGIIAAVVWFALSGAMTALVGAGLTTPIAIPTVQDATTSPVLTTEPAGVPAAESVARDVTPSLQESQPAAEGLAHPSAAPRPAPIIERQERAASPIVDRAAERPITSGTTAERPAPPDQSVADGGDGGAIIDWILNRRR